MNRSMLLLKVFGLAGLICGYLALAGCGSGADGWATRANSSLSALETQLAKTSDGDLASIIKQNIKATKTLISTNDAQGVVFSYALLTRSSATSAIRVAWVQAGAPSVTGVRLVLNRSVNRHGGVYLNATAFDYAENLKDSKSGVVFGANIEIPEPLVGHLHENPNVAVVLIGGNRELGTGELWKGVVVH
jgi:hypothetical protein